MTPEHRAHIQQLADMIREQNVLNAQQRVTEAQIIRWCVAAITRDPDAGVRGFEDYKTRLAIRKVNSEDRHKALLYLEWLATRMETVRSSDDQPKET